MAKLEDLTPGVFAQGIPAVPNEVCEIIAVTPYGRSAVVIIYKVRSTGALAEVQLGRDDEQRVRITENASPWSFRTPGRHFRLASEAQRIQMAHLVDPHLAVNTSNIEPLPHQITAVYEEMLKRQPLRFLLADDPGAGKTIMAGLLIKELIARGDLERCLIVCPSSLVIQWVDELSERFNLSFTFMTDEVKNARTNWFSENQLVIASLDKLVHRSYKNAQDLLQDESSQWDLVICDEAHRMSATFSGSEPRYTKRYLLGRDILSRQTRNFLLLTATPHNGREADFQLFMRLLDDDRFEGRFCNGVHATDVSDLMRRLMKENLFKFDGAHLFPERRAHALPYELSEGESGLYKAVTKYVQEEFNRAAALDNNRARNIGFALTILQRRLASSPEAIYQSLRRRRERLETSLNEIQASQAEASLTEGMNFLDEEDLERLDDAYATYEDIDEAEREVFNRATAARTVEELKAEIASLAQLQSLADNLRSSGEDKKWQEVAELLNQQMFTDSSNRKLIIFTEHRDTLYWLRKKVTDLVGSEFPVRMIHGGVTTDDRHKIQEDFQNDPRVRILLANDAASEGINLHRANLMVNYDLPWNPNRIEQRFGRIHRIGQTEVCHLWNLIAKDTREGDVYETLLDKLDQARQTLGGQVFDVLGKLQFGGKSLKDLMIEAVKYGEKPEIKARLTKQVSDAVDTDHLRELLKESLTQDSMDTDLVYRIREDMERAQARRLQPHYIRSFFVEAIRGLGGHIPQREPHRYYIKRVPEQVRQHSLRRLGKPLPESYERIAFEKDASRIGDYMNAEFIAPGHPLLDATVELTLDTYGKQLQQGAVLVDENDPGNRTRLLLYLDHTILDGGKTSSGEPSIASRRMQYVELDETGHFFDKEYAPYLDYRPLNHEKEPSAQDILNQRECAWVGEDVECLAIKHAVENIAPNHMKEVRQRRLEFLTKTETAVRDRLSKEIAHWNRRAVELQGDERRGKRNARLNSDQARRRAEDAKDRLDRRLEELEQAKNLSSQPPKALGAALIVPMGLLSKISGASAQSTAELRTIRDTQAIAARARNAVMDVERRLGYEPVDREFDRLGYDIESRAADGKLRFIEVKGRAEGADTITVTKNEVLTCLNKPDDYILAIVEFKKGGTEPAVYYVRNPFKREPDFGANSVNYDMAELLESAELQH